MDNDYKLMIFKNELNYIQDKKVKEYVEKALLGVPDYFFEVAASSTGKYHPVYAGGIGGLVRHTIAAVRIAVELFTLDMFKKEFNNEAQSLIIASLILHDTYKHGNGSEFTVTNHPLVAVEKFAKNGDLSEILDENKKEVLFGNIAHHMGQWVNDPKTKQQVLEKPRGKMQNFVHLCDYLASRKCLEFNFDAEVIRR